jgi:hypothetical protein
VTEKDLSITICAYLKEIINMSTPDAWADQTKQAIRAHKEVTQWVMDGMKEEE